MRRYLCILLITMLALTASCKANPPQESAITGAAQKPDKTAACSPEIELYVNFLGAVPLTDPVDYVIGLFDKYDIVVLCERDHRDITQYELIYDIVRDERFIEKSGCVFMEKGSQTNNGKLNALLQTEGLDREALDEQLISVYRDLDYACYWEKYNLYDFYKNVYYLNNTLSGKDKIRIIGADMPIDWNGMTPEKYKLEITDKLDSRDKIMADFITQQYRDIEKSGSEKSKILVIMNYHHAFKLFEGKTTEILNNNFPGRVANVMLNSLKIMPGANDKNDIREPVQDGMWDAAFRYLGNPDAGFDFANTPFGQDVFDYSYACPYKYQDIFTGYVFYRPLEEHLLVWNIPGFLDEEFFATYIKRLQIINPTVPDISEISQEQMNQEKINVNEKTEEVYPDMMRYDAIIDKWLNQAPES